MTDFFKSNHCKIQAHCTRCRAFELGIKFRTSLMANYNDMNEVNFECPYGKKWDTITQKPKIKKKNIKYGGCHGCGGKKQEKKIKIRYKKDKEH